MRKSSGFYAKRAECPENTVRRTNTPFRYRNPRPLTSASPCPPGSLSAVCLRFAPAPAPGRSGQHRAKPSPPLCGPTLGNRRAAKAGKAADAGPAAFAADWLLLLPFFWRIPPPIPSRKTGDEGDGWRKRSLALRGNFRCLPPCGLSGHNRFDHVENPALLVTGQAGHLIEDLFGAALRATAPLWSGFPTDQKIQRGAERLGHGRKLFRLQANAFAFPVGDEFLGDAKAFGHLLLSGVCKSWLNAPFIFPRIWR